MTKIAIAVVSWGEAEITRLCLESLIATAQYPIQIFWVQNEFERDRENMIKIEDWIAQNEHPVKIYHETENHNWSKGVNIALRNIYESDEFSYVVMMNNDIIVYNGWDKSMIERFKDEEDIGAVATLVDNGNFQEVVNMASANPNIIPAIRNNESLEQYSNRIIQNNNSFIRTHDLSFSFVMLSFEAAKTIGCVDERFYAGYGVDTDYSTSLRHAGYKIGLDPNVVVHHDHGGSSKHTIHDRDRYGREAMDMLKDKWKEEGYW